jgi:hypothetical protein
VLVNLGSELVVQRVLANAQDRFVNPSQKGSRHASGLSWAIHAAMASRSDSDEGRDFGPHYLEEPV